MSEPFKAIPRDEFLSRRREVIEAAKFEKIKLGDSFIVIDPEDDIICDSCNAEIEDALVWMNSSGAYCVTCRRGERHGHGHD